MGAVGELCSVPGCPFPVFWTAEKLCRDHALHPPATPEPEPEVAPPSRPAPGRATTPKE